MYPRCHWCGKPITGGGMATTVFGNSHMGGCPKPERKMEVIAVVYKIRRPDGKFKGHGRGVWTRDGKTWSSLNDLKGHLRLSEKYPKGCVVVSYELTDPKERSLEELCAK